MLRAVIVVTAACLSFASCEPDAAKSATAPKCALTYADATTRGRAAVVDHPSWVFTDYSGGEAAKLLAAFNAMPPASKDVAEHILVLETEPESPDLVGFVHNGCVVKGFRARREAWTKMRDEAIGSSS